MNTVYSINELLKKIDDYSNNPSRREEWADVLVEIIREMVSDNRLEEICKAEKDKRFIILPEDGQIYHIESAIDSNETWVGNKPIRYIDSEGYHCGRGIAIICFKFTDLGKTVFLTREAAEDALKERM